MGELTFTTLAELGEFPDVDALDILARFVEAEVPLPNLSHTMHSLNNFKSQFTPKIFNLLFQSVTMNNKLTILWGG